jgi:hypothetical protein
MILLPSLAKGLLFDGRYAIIVLEQMFLTLFVPYPVKL